MIIALQTKTKHTVYGKKLKCTRSLNYNFISLKQINKVIFLIAPDLKHCQRKVNNFQVNKTLLPTKLPLTKKDIQIPLKPFFHASIMNFVVSLLSFPHFYFMEVLKLLRVVKTTLIKAQTMGQYKLPNKVLRNKHTPHIHSYTRCHYYNRNVLNYPRLLMAGKFYVFTHVKINQQCITLVCTIFCFSF